LYNFEAQKESHKAMQDFADGQLDRLKENQTICVLLSVNEVVDFIDKWLQSRSGVYSTA